MPSDDDATLRRLVSMAASIRTQCEELKRVHDDGTFRDGTQRVAVAHACPLFSYLYTGPTLLCLWMRLQSRYSIL
jgi:hypothetical protein